MTNKYTYYRVIQQEWGNGWDDVDFHLANSSYFPLDYKAYIENFKAYRNEQNAPVRVINRRELTTS